MKRIGLTGNMGSGKSTVSKIFEVLGVPVFYSDAEARQCYDLPEVQQQLQDWFPESSLFIDGKLDRAAMASLIFTDERALAMVNGLIHPLVEARYQRWAATLTNNPYVLQESAILFEHSLQHRYDAVIVVTAPEALRIQRVMQRDGTGTDAVGKRIRAQWAEEEKMKQARFVVVNDGKQWLIPQVLAIHQTLL